MQQPAVEMAQCSYWRLRHMKRTESINWQQLVKFTLVNNVKLWKFLIVQWAMKSCPYTEKFCLVEIDVDVWAAKLFKSALELWANSSAVVNRAVKRLISLITLTAWLIFLIAVLTHIRSVKFFSLCSIYR